MTHNGVLFMFFVFYFLVLSLNTLKSVACAVFTDRKKKFLATFFFFLNHHEFGSEDETLEAFWLSAPGTSSSAAGSTCKWQNSFIEPPNT